jgi:hypothetical protein
LKLPSTSGAPTLQFSVAYGTTESRPRLAAIEAIAFEIAPQLGWRPLGTVVDSTAHVKVAALEREHRT